MRKKKGFKLDIYGQEYSVEYVDRVFDPADNSECCGLCDMESSKILINNKMNKELTACTILHELFHAYSRRMGMENSGMSSELEELIADQFAKVLTENFDFRF